MAVAALASPAAAAGTTSTVVPIASFAVTSSQCAGGTQSQPVQQLQWDLVSLFPPHGTPTLPTVSLNPGCTAAPALLSSVIAASNTVTSSPTGSATVSSQALGNAVLTEQANADVELTASIPLSSPASSVEVAIPYTTSGVTWSGSTSGAGVYVGPAGDTPRCADGSIGTASPFSQRGWIHVTPLGTPTPPGSGTVDGIRFSCPDGSDLVSALGFRVVVATSVYSADAQTQSASADFRMHDVTATVDSAAG